MGEGHGQGTLPWGTLRGGGKTQEICSPPLRRPFPSWVRLKPFEIRHKRPSSSFSGGREGGGEYKFRPPPTDRTGILTCAMNSAAVSLSVSLSPPIPFHLYLWKEVFCSSKRGPAG